MLARRATFLLDGDGIVRRTWDLEDPDIESGSHPADVLAAARELGAS
jgi:peroxiredoxin